MLLINLFINLFNVLKVKTLECLSVTNQKCMARPKILSVNKCSGSCDTLDDPMAKLCVPNVIKSANMKFYNFLMRLNETRNVLWHKSCKCVCQFIGLFSVLMFTGITCFCIFAYFKWIKGKKVFEKRFENKHFNDVIKIDGDY